MEYLVKVNRMGAKAVVFGMGMGDDRTATFDVAVKDYVSDSALPVDLSSGAAGAEEEREGQRSTTEQSLQHVFVSPDRVNDLASLFKVNIIQKIMPSLYKEGYEETRSSTRAATGDDQRSSQQPSRRRDPDQEDPLRGSERLPPPARPYPFDDPLAVPPRRPYPVADFPPPGFEDEYDLTRPPRGPLPPDLGGGRHPLGIGHDDLYPPGLGPHDPLAPAGGLRRPGGLGGGGMHPTFEDPLFRGPGGQGGHDPR